MYASIYAHTCIEHRVAGSPKIKERKILRVGCGGLQTVRIEKSMSYNTDWPRQDSVDNFGCSYENLGYDHRLSTASNGIKSRENSINVSAILFDDHFSPRLSDGLNSMRFSDLGDITEEEW